MQLCNHAITQWENSVLNQHSKTPREKFPNRAKHSHVAFSDASESHLDDIKVDYHPHSQIPSTIHHFADFSCTHPTEASVPQNHTPWEPFQTRLDFEVTEISLEAALTAEQTNRLFNLIHCFTFDVVSVPYQNKVHEFDMHYHPLWEWALHMQKLSSFGTQKAYLIVCRIANLPVEIQNGTGWLPIVSKDSEHAGKSSFVNFKNAVWHKSFLKLLESVIQISRMGYWFECGGAIQRLLWPLILILSADYKEQCIMALICGLKDELSFFAESEETLQLACAKKSKKEREKLLKTYSLPLSFDCMHVYHGGLWRHHLWRELQFWMLELGREAVLQLDVKYWSNLMHFSKVVGVDFNDSSHHEDISRMAIFVAQRILRHSQSKLSYLLLRCICHYIDLDIYAGFEVHTEDSIVAGRQALRECSEYILKSQPVTGKDWNFPRKHASSHLFDDILAKGATQNYNMKLNEKMHGPVRDIYHNQTNFKDVTAQYNRKANLPTAEDADTENPAISVAPAPCTHVKLGSAQGDISFASFEHFLNTFFPSNNIPLPDGKRIHLQADNKITGYKYLQVNYESMVDWRQCKDLLQCNSEFFGSPRYDCVMVQTDNQPFFAHLIFMFGCSIGETNLSLALIDPYNVGIGVHSKHDTDLGLWRVRARPRLIIQGTALASDPGRQGDYFIINMVDADMFLRVKSLQVA
ncbi:hypothetical protein BDR07DRAFT_1453666 [Suillus spraguei]|nr:hypothetical protein BDR07DRAFT_1453666 [Suillus spraguei]